MSLLRALVLGFLLSHSSIWQGLPGVCDSRQWITSGKQRLILSIKTND